MWIKLFRQRKVQSVMIFLIIAICTTLMAGSISILTSLEKPSKDFAKKCDAAAARVYPYLEKDEEVFKLGNQFKTLPGVEKVEYVKRHYISEDLLLKGKKVELFANLTKLNEATAKTNLFLEGDIKNLYQLKSNECLLPAGIANEYGLHQGDKVEILLGSGKISYQVAAIYTNPYATSSAFDSDILVKDLPKVSGSYYMQIYTKEGVTGGEIKEAYYEKYNGMLHATVLTLEERIENGLIVGHIIGAIFLAIGIIMLLVSIMMIYYMIKNAMIADASSIAIYKTIGYTFRDIFKMYIKYYFAMVTAACFIGVLGSVVVSNGILSSIFMNMGYLHVNGSFIWGIMCYIFIVVVVISVIGLIILRTKSTKPVGVLSGTDFGGVRKASKLSGNTLYFFSPFGMALRSLLREKKAVISMVITCMITIFSVNFIIISLDVADQMGTRNDYWIGLDPSDIMVNLSDSDNLEEVSQYLKADSRTKSIYYNNLDKRVVMRWKKGEEVTDMTAFVYDDYSVCKLPVTEGNNPSSSDEIAISTKMATQLHKSVGDYLTVYLDETHKADLLITGKFQSYMQFGAMSRLTAQAYIKRGIPFQYSNISVYMKNQDELDSYLKDMGEKIGSKGKVIRRTEQYASIMKMIVEPQKKAIPPVAVLIVLIAAINIFCIVYLRNIKNQKINGIYKSMGYTTKHIVGANLWYVGMVALGALPLAFGITLLAYVPIMKLCLQSFHFQTYPMEFQLSHLLIGNVLIIGIFILSTLFSSKSIGKVSVRQLTQE